MYCNRCGKPIRENNLFCEQCGAKQMMQQTWMSQPVQPQVSYAPQYIQPLKGVGRGWKIAFFCSLSAAVLTISIFAYFTRLAPRSGVQTAWNEDGVMAADNVFGAYFAKPADVQKSAQLAQPDDITAQVPMQDTDTLFSNGLTVNVAEYLADTWWGSSGSSIDNPNASPTAAGYPKVYNLRAGENQYIFYLETQTVQMLHQEEDGTITDCGEYEYTLDPYGFYLYSFHRTSTIDGIDRDIYSAFFVCDGVLYEVEMMDEYEVSNYIAFTIYGP